MTIHAHDILQGIPSPEGRKHTTRTPDSNGFTNDARLESAVKASAEGLSNALYYLLNSGTDGPGGKPLDNHARSWDKFANHLINKVDGKDGREENFVSLESWHDDIHVLVGSGASTGHMASVPVAAVGTMTKKTNGYADS